MKGRMDHNGRLDIRRFREQMAEHSKEQKLLELKLEEFRRKHNIVSFGAEREFLVSDMKGIKEELYRSKLEKLEIQTVLLQIFRTKQEGTSLL